MMEAALVPAYHRGTAPRSRPFMNIHNLAYQGLSRKSHCRIGAPEDLFISTALEFYDKRSSSRRLVYA